MRTLAKDRGKYYKILKNQPIVTLIIRQLVGLARAVLRRSSIVILDEVRDLHCLCAFLVQQRRCLREYCSLL